jgi:acetolactate decarboxylase
MKKMICFVLLLSLTLVLTGCNTTTVVYMLDRHALYQSPPLAHLKAGHYDTSLTVEQFKSLGNFGTGIFDRFAGEAVLLNGVTYQIADTGNAVIPAEQESLLFGTCMLFDVEKRFAMRNVPAYADFKDSLQRHFSTNLHIHAIQVDGVFNTIRVSCIQPQSPPYKPFDQATRQVKEYAWQNVRGTLVGFWTPPSVPEAIMAPGFHLLFISEDKKLGGHVVDFQSDKLTILLKQVMRLTLNYTPQASTRFDTAPQ